MNMQLSPPEARTPPSAQSGRRQALRVRLCLMILLVDCLSVLAACLIGNMARFGDALAAPGLNLFAVVLPVFIGIAINSDAYASDVLTDLRTGFSRAAVAYVFAVLSR